MLTLPHSVKIYIAAAPTNMRKTFNGLSAEVQSVLNEDVLSGHLFVFFNKRKPPTGNLSGLARVMMYMRLHEQHISTPHAAYIRRMGSCPQTS
jgi:transposase